MRNLMDLLHKYPRSTAYIIVMVTLIFFMQLWEVTR